MDSDSQIGPLAIVPFGPGLRVSPMRDSLPESGPVVRRVNPIPFGVARDCGGQRSFVSLEMEGIERG